MSAEDEVDLLRKQLCQIDMILEGKEDTRTLYLKMHGWRIARIRKLVKLENFIKEWMEND